MQTEQPESDVAVEELVPQPIVSIRGIIPTAELGEHHGARLRALVAYLRQQSAQPAGHPFVRYHTFDADTTDVEVGIPVAAALPGVDSIKPGILPGGPALTTWHVGPHVKLGDAYARIAAGLEAQGRAAASPSWEVYAWIDPSQEPDSTSEEGSTDWRTQLVQPITAAEPE